MSPTKAAATPSDTALKRLVEASGIRRERLAADAEISVSYLRLLERGMNSPSLVVARRLAAVLGRKVDQLFPVEV